WIALIAVGHGLANLMLQQPSRGIGDADLLAQLHSGNPFLVLAHTIDRPEPTGEGNPGLVKNGSRGHRTLVPTGGTFFHLPTRHIASTATPTAGTPETVRPALAGQVARTLVMVAEARAKFLYRQDSSLFQPLRLFHHLFAHFRHRANQYGAPVLGCPHAMVLARIDHIVVRFVPFECHDETISQVAI